MGKNQAEKKPPAVKRAARGGNATTPKPHPPPPKPKSKHGEIRDLAALKAAPIWLWWKAVPEAGRSKPRKVPHYASGQRRSGQQGTKQDREQLVNFAAAELANKKFSGSGVGFALFDDLGIVVVDVDNAMADEGGIKKRAADLLKQLCVTYCERSPSGNGFHAIFRGTVNAASKPNIGDNIGLELFNDARFICWTGGYIHDSAADLVDLPDALRTELHALVHAKQNDKGKSKAAGKEHSFDPSNPDEQALAAEALTFLNPDDRPVWIDVALALGHSFKQDDVGYAILTAWASRSGKYKEAETRKLYYEESKKPRDSEITMGRIFKDAEKAGWDARVSVVAEMNKKHALISVAGKYVVLTELVENGKWSGFELSKVADMRIKYANTHVFFTQGEEIKVKSKFDAWLESPRRRDYDKIVFDPPDSKNPKPVSPRHFNLWHGFAYEPKKGECGLFWDHVRDNICINAPDPEKAFKYVKGWMASMVQHPNERQGKALVLRGGEGTGKGTFGVNFGKLFGPHYVHVTQPGQVTGKHNAHIQDKLFIFSDEAIWSGDRAGESVLKSMITDESLMIEPKFVDAYPVTNRVHLLMASNKDWAAPVGIATRRFAVFDVSDAKMQDTGYFDLLTAQMKNGGYEALLYDLLNYDLKKEKFDPNDIPKTAALFDQKVATMDPIQQWVVDFVTDRYTHFSAAKWEDEGARRVIAKKDLIEDYLEHAKQTGRVNRQTETEFGIALRRLIPGVSALRAGGGRVPSYKFPTLGECRAAVAKAMRTEIDWGTATDEQQPTKRNI